MQRQYFVLFSCLIVDSFNNYEVLDSLSSFQTLDGFCCCIACINSFFPNKRLSCVNINLHAFWPCGVGQVVILNELQYIVYTHQEY